MVAEAKPDVSPVWHLGPLTEHLPMRVRLAAPLSDDELFELCARNRELRIERSAEGELIIMSPTGFETGQRNAYLIMQVTQWSLAAGGVALDSNTGFLLPNGAQRAPDVAWVSAARAARLSSAQKRRFAPLCPDFVIELASPSDVLDEVHGKMREYIEQGARLGWLIAPDQQAAYIYRPGVAMVTLARPACLTGDPELPALIVQLDRIW
jgi:Uma2 family endonuclease